MTSTLSSSLEVGNKVLANMGGINRLHKKTGGAGRLCGAEVTGYSLHPGRDRVHHPTLKRPEN